VHPLTALSEYRRWRIVPPGISLNPGICSRRRILAFDTRVHEPYQQDPSCAQGLEALQLHRDFQRFDTELSGLRGLP
jgi:hypothetical protein